MAKAVGALKASRKASDEAYRQLVKSLNAYALIEGDSKYYWRRHNSTKFYN